MYTDDLLWRNFLQVNNAEIARVTLTELLNPDHAPFTEDFSSAGWDLLWKVSVPNMKYLGLPVTKL